MDPNLFHLDWDQTAEVLGTIVVLAFIVERALALIFENQAYVERLGDKPIKEVITFAVCLGVCLYWHLDALAVILHGEHESLIGKILTAGIIAGGSKAALRLFRDVLKVENEKSKEARKVRTDEFRRRIEAQEAVK